MPENETGIREFPAETVMRIATGFMESKCLFAGVELGVFEHLARGPLPLPALAQATGAPERPLRVLADALTSIGLLRKDGRGYANTAAGALLSGRGAADLRDAMRQFDRINYEDWAELALAVRTGAPTREALDEERARILGRGIDALTAPLAAALCARFDFGAHRRLLDLGGGEGSLLIAILRRFPGLEGTLVDREDAVLVARSRIAAASLASRAQTMAGDLFEFTVPSGHDVFLLANVLHLMSPDRCCALLKRLRAGTTTEQARLLIVDLFTNEARTEPRFAALMAGTFLTAYGEGDVHPLVEVKGWLAKSGWRVEETAGLNGASQLIVAAAT